MSRATLQPPSAGPYTGPLNDSPPSAPGLSVIVPVRNAAAHLERCLAAIFSSRFRDFECLVVDDASTDGSAETAERLGCRVFRLATNQGPASARNLAARKARAEILFFTDADVAITPDTLGRVKKHFGQDPYPDAVIGSYDDDPPGPRLLSQYKTLQQHFVHQTSSEHAFAFWSGCGAVRKELFLRLGGFSESYPRPAVEDIEFGHRLTADGGRILLDKGLQVKHWKRWTLGKLLRTDVFDRGVPWTELILSRSSMPRDLNLQLLQRLSVVLMHLAVSGLAAWAIFFRASPAGFVAPVAAAAVVAAINARFYAFLARRRGIWFAARAIPLHFLYYYYSGIAFLIGALRYGRKRWFRTPRRGDEPRERK